MEPKAGTQPLFDPAVVGEVKKEIEQANSVLVILPPEPTTDQVAAGLALYLSCEQMGKSAQIGCSSQIKVENADLFGVDKVRTSVGNQNLLISFNFKEEDLKKVDYDIDENGRFSLLIQPQPGIEPPDSSTIQYNYSGAAADLVFVIGVYFLEELGKVYADEKAFLDHAKIVSLNQTTKPGGVGAFQLHAQASCLSEAVAFLLKAWQVEPTPDAASNLLTTISASTHQFNSPKVSADTFETVAFLMRHGARLTPSPLVASSRFGAFPPSPFGPPVSFGPPALTPPIFEGDYEPVPFPKANPDWKKPRIFRAPPKPDVPLH